MRSAACLVLGDNRYEPASPKLVRLILDPSPRVAHYAATACSKLGAAAFDAAVKLLQQADNQDPVLRHAAVLAMFKSPATDQQISQLSKHPSMAVRLGAVVALRRRNSSAVEAFLNDSNNQIVAEAARAIHDLPIHKSFGALAKLVSSETLDDETRFRALNANYRLGASENAMQVAMLANNSAVAELLRIEAVKMLVAWEKPDERDRYLNAWRPLEPRDASVAKNAARNVVASLLGESEEIQTETLKAVVAFHLTEFLDQVVSLTTEKSAAGIRAEALFTIAKVDKKRASQIVDPLLNDADWQVSGAALEVLANVDPVRASKALPRALTSPDVQARQAAWRLAKTLSEQPAASELLARGLEDYLSGKLPLEESLEVLEAIESKNDASMTAKLEEQSSKWQETDPVQQWRWALAGGDAKKGRNVFLFKSEVSCLRCHKVGNQGGEVGPALTELGAKKDAHYLLEAIVLPNAKIAEGFESVSILDDAGTVHTGVLKRENDQFVEYMTAEGKLQRVDKEAIEQRRKANSAMPADLVKSLSRNELRDLVAYLVSLKEPIEQGH